MPIANCIVAPNCPPGSGNLIEWWGTSAGIAPDEMTINFIQAQHQLGKPYLVMASLQLPSLWSNTQITQLQTGLSLALARYFQVSEAQVQIITQVIASGQVVENGDTLRWN